MEAGKARERKRGKRQTDGKKKRGKEWKGAGAGKPW
jgi:hypothetical protein